MLFYTTTTDSTSPLTILTTTLKQTSICGAECLNRALRAVIFGVMPMISILICLALIRIIISKVEIFYYRRQKKSHRRISLSAYQAGRLVLPYTPVAPAELQRIIQGEHSTAPRIENSKQKYGGITTNNTSSIFLQTSDDTNTSSNRKTFLKSITTSKVKQPSASTLSSLVMKRDNVEANPFMSLLTTSQTPVILNVSNETEFNDNTTRQYLCVRRESVETISISSSVPGRSSDILDFYYNISEEPQTTDEIETTTVVVQESTENYQLNPSPLTEVTYESTKNETSALSLSDNNYEQKCSPSPSNECLAQPSS
ncbi:unnamed protein product [Didymodactylos carnosus]|uniref:Uncharacterized protein n=1 Tax=Didymodactylos carnosus TaxID=1234261 RepID=A0A813Z0S8_9BILA|nr:unnamed protein product [Didymodactylos carnosus]CAF3675899.1 unnamed protein product [Didymodactylos carnosus]CAF3714952.1 unnamed protein product [Didymodactylos carnosus]